jgi:hypothetical protein
MWGMKKKSKLQQTDEWIKARLGKATASRMGDVMAKIKSGAPSASRKNYLTELMVERMTGEPYPHHVSPEMQYGIDTQPEAVAAYCFQRNVDVADVGFVPHPFLPMTGCSPDGLIGPGNRIARLPPLRMGKKPRGACPRK